jgi:hypothetical protein
MIKTYHAAPDQPTYLERPIVVMKNGSSISTQSEKHCVMCLERLDARVGPTGQPDQVATVIAATLPQPPGVNLG